MRRHALLFPAQFWLLVGGTYLYLIGYEIGYPFETIYLHSRLGISMTSVGLIIGLPILAGLPVQVAGGAIADRLGRKVVLVIASSAGIVLFEGLAFARMPWQVVAVIATEAVFGWAMFLTANNAMLADFTPPARRSEAYGISRVANNAGMVTGPLIAALLLAAGFGYRMLFASGGFVCALFLVAMLIFLRESRPVAAATPPPPGGGYRAVLGDHRFLALCAVALLPLYGFGQIFITLPVLLRDSIGVSASQWGLLASLYAAAGVLFQLPVVRRTRSLDKLAVLSLASVCLGLGLAGAAVAPKGIGTAACVLLISAGSMLVVPIAPALVSQMAPLELRGRYMGVWTLVWMTGTALAPIFGGLALSDLGRAASLVILAVCLVGAVLFAVLRSAPRAAGTP